MKTNVKLMLFVLVAVLYWSACDEFGNPLPSGSQEMESDTMCFPTDKNLIFQNALINVSDAEAAVNAYAKGFYAGLTSSGDSIKSLLPNQERIDYTMLRAALGAVNSSTPTHMVIRYGSFSTPSGPVIKSFAYFVDDKDNIIEVEDPNNPGQTVKLIFNDFFRCPPQICNDKF